MARRGKSIRGGYRGGSAAGASRNRGGPKKHPLTHFLCIPLVTDTSRPQLDSSLSQFRDLVAEENMIAVGEKPETVPIPLKAIRPISTIHFTIGVMSLMSEDRVAEAIGYLQTIDLNNLMEEVLQERQDSSSASSWPIRISLTSLHSMHPPEKTSILYAGPEDSNGLFGPFCVKLCERFRAAGFLVADSRPLKLHATILNTIYANPGGRGKQPEAASKESGTRADSVAIVQQERDVSRAETGTNPSWADQQTATETPTSSANTGTSRGHGPNAKAPIRLDATALLERCKDFVWAADFALEKIAICKMGAKKITDEQGTIIDEQYEEVAFITLP